MLDKKISAPIAISIIALIAVVVGIVEYWQYLEIQYLKFEVVRLKSPRQGSDPLNTSYMIEGESFILIRGKSEKEILPGSATKIKTSVWNGAERGDLDGDGIYDGAVILIHEPGGSGTFYYVAAAMKDPEDNMFAGTNAVLLGDRVSVDDISIEEEVIMVDYNIRGEDDPMTTTPYIAVTGRFIVEEGELKELE